ncbi:GNAT family N-acetyltransferase [Desulfosarcina sp.]|uniref:GNAT family N-acetyltransferase n=1 Tax=Desulfosarcina sp. TaxID=2027861 RepID=UPI0029AEA574|nr:GNAT family N-acetyltransferase [Desulfosarcina sp.]MDX2453495.1 GNAT family N-acetyltransferase [Desulfosarcina sp.]MDX2491206.1 GNAT family N-acetyltransferase [Desulfosarcina sp.]
MNPNSYFLKTERIGFRKWAENDLDLAVGLWSDIEVTKRIDARGKLSREQIADRFVKEIAVEREWGVQYWPVFLLKNDDHIGVCGLRPYDSPNNIFEIGFHLRSDLWRKGYATEAARAIIRYAFADLKLGGLFAGHHPKNEASRLLLIKLGFRYTHDEYYEPTGLQHPSYLMEAADYASSFLV